jgi:O-acetyl-ADP-ribose deacetylase (regulator of RNase III)
VEGDIFLTDCNSIGHGINCMGKMGAGIALEIRNKYPDTYKWYKFLFDSGQLSPGNVYAYIDKKVIFNLSSQKYYGRRAGVKYASIENIEKCFKKLPKLINNINESLKEKNREPINGIAFPRIGCSLGGLTWEEVNPIFEKYLSNTLPIIIYTRYIPGFKVGDKEYLNIGNF